MPSSWPRAPIGSRTARRAKALLADPTLDIPPDDHGTEKGPLRRCLVTRARHPKEAMLRFVLAPDGTILPDLAARLPGRGMWLSARADVLEAAQKRGALTRAAAKSVDGAKLQPRLPGDMGASIIAGLEARVQDTLGLARRAGQAVCGFEAVREWAAKGRIGLLVEASDGAAGGREKLARLLDGVPGVAPLDGFALGRVFGRDHAVHVGIAPGRLAGLIAMECSRLAGMRPAKTHKDTNGTDGG